MPNWRSVIQLFIECDDEEVETAANEPVSSLVGHPKISFEVILPNQYFVKNSESYYIPIATDALLKHADQSRIEGSQSLEKSRLMSIRRSQTEKLCRPQTGLNKTQDHKDTELCYVCYSGSQNAVFMTCGHGGICYNCARACINKKPQCLECRAPVEGIAYIDEETGTDGVFRSSKTVRVIVDHSLDMDEVM